jgi:hypothetical protein
MLSDNKHNNMHCFYSILFTEGFNARMLIFWRYWKEARVLEVGLG